LLLLLLLLLLLPLLLPLLTATPLPGLEPFSPAFMIVQADTQRASIDSKKQNFKRFIQRFLYFAAASTNA
jgi:hypothetical protein